MTLMSEVRPQALVGDLFRQQRKHAGLKQAEVAARLGVPQSFVSKYESGERKLDLVEAHDVCKALGIKLTDFSALFEQKLEQGV